MWNQTCVLLHIPQSKIYLRLNDFERHLKKLFGNCPKMKSNLPGCLERLLLLLTLGGMKDIVFALADKNWAQWRIPWSSTLEMVSPTWVTAPPTKLYQSRKLLKEMKSSESISENGSWNMLLICLRMWGIFWDQSLMRPRLALLVISILLYNIHKDSNQDASLFQKRFWAYKDFEKPQSPESWSVFSFDAISMYTNIDTQDCISRLFNFLLDPKIIFKYPHCPAKALWSRSSCPSHGK